MLNRAVALNRDRMTPSDHPTWVFRPRLLRKLAGPVGGSPPPIVVISAPAGAGKSVLTRQWLELDDRRHVEIGLTAALNEPSTLDHALTAALERLGQGVRRIDADITTTEPSLSARSAPALARVAADNEHDFVLVVDDVHLLSDPGCHLVLRAVCDGAPPGSQVILLTREEAPPWLERLRAEDRLEEVSGRELRLDVDEAAELLAAMDLTGNEALLSEIVERTEGWAVGLHLAGSAMRQTVTSQKVTGQRATGQRATGQADRPHPLLPDINRTFERSIRGYVTAEILTSLNPAFESFVLRIAVLDMLEPGLCDAVTERNDSLTLLTRLEQLQLVTPADGPGHQVRYQRLLGETLLAELTRRAPAEIPILHARASRWYSDRGMLDDAIRHAKAADDTSQVGRLVWSGCGESIGSGDKDRAALWLADLPEVAIARDRWLTLAAAWVALQSGRTDESDRWILRAEGHAGEGWSSQARTDPYAAELAVIVALVGRDGLAVSTTLSSAALDGLPAESPFRAVALFVRGVGLTLKRSVESGRGALAEAERTARVLRVPLVQADTQSWLGILALTAGDLTTARRIIKGATGIVESFRLERLSTAAHSITAQALLQALARDPAAPATLVSARRLTAELHDAVPWLTVCGRLIQARTAVVLGDGVHARQLLNEAGARMTPDLQDSLAHDLYQDTERALSLIRQGRSTQPSLTAAELRVLQFLPSHLQLPQIGEHLFVSANTVKTHVMSIHRKLGVTSRDQVVARARALGLIDVRGDD